MNLYIKYIWYVCLSALFLEGLAVFGMCINLRGYLMDGTYLDISFHPISIEIEALGAKEIDKILMLN